MKINWATIKSKPEAEQLVDIGHMVANRLWRTFNWIEIDELIGVAFLAVTRANGLFDSTRSSNRLSFIYSKGYWLSIDDLRKNHGVHKATTKRPKIFLETDRLAWLEEDRPLATSYLQKEIASCSDWLQDLMPREKFILKLHFDDDMNYKEIGELLGITRSWVSKISSAAIKVLKETRKAEFNEISRA